MVGWYALRACSSSYPTSAMSRCSALFCAAAVAPRLIPSTTTTEYQVRRVIQPPVRILSLRRLEVPQIGRPVDSRDLRIQSLNDASPHPPMIGQRHRVDAPVEGRQILQVEPVKLEGEQRSL